MPVFSISKLEDDDFERFIDVIKLFEEVFEMKKLSIPNSGYLKKLLNKDDFMVFVALCYNQVVGGLTAYSIEQYYSKKLLVYIYDLAVDIKYQRNGIGKQLISEINNYCSKKGYEEVFLQAEKVDDHAIKFYRSTRPTEELQTINFSYTLEKK